VTTLSGGGGLTLSVISKSFTARSPLTCMITHRTDVSVERKVRVAYRVILYWLQLGKLEYYGLRDVFPEEESIPVGHSKVYMENGRLLAGSNPAQLG
jgi:hypothetical protein